MSFSSDVKEELAKQVSKSRHCQLAELAGIIELSGRINEKTKGLELDTENLLLLNKYATLMKRAFGTDTTKALDEQAKQLQELLCGFDTDAKIVERKGHYVVYIKEGAHIVDSLNIMEAYVSLMKLENVRILKEMRNSVNRKVNCETANISKTVNAAVKQIEDIRLIQKMRGLDDLPAQLREMALLRLEYPDAPLKELGGYLDPPMGKSGVNHRLRKLSAIAEELR